MWLIYTGALGNDNQFAGDLLPAAGLVTSSEEYYPTVAINALMRNLRDPAMSSHHPQVIRSLFYIFQALHLGSVPYLPKVILTSCHFLNRLDAFFWCLFLVPFFGAFFWCLFPVTKAALEDIGAKSSDLKQGLGLAGAHLAMNNAFLDHDRSCQFCLE